MKTTSESDSPNKAFTEELIEEALDELKKSPTCQQRDKSNGATRSRLIKTISWAAMLMIICSVCIALIIPSLSKVKKLSYRVVSGTNLKGSGRAQTVYNGFLFYTDGEENPMAHGGTTPPNNAAYKEGCINRVILCSDGVANVGRTGHEQILQVIKDKADKGITLSAMGFGMGNYNDVLMERLGDKGNGYYAYIDTLDQAKRLFAGNLTGALQVVARDVKNQVDFNPEVVRSYRLIGYENRDVADNKFRDDKEDGGEIGAGHSVTALYEIKLWDGKTGPVATTYVRYKHPETREVTEFNRTFTTSQFRKDFSKTSPSFALATAVTEFAEVLRKSYWAKDKTLDHILQQAPRLREEFDGDKDVTELIRLIETARKLKANQPPEDHNPEATP